MQIYSDKKAGTMRRGAFLKCFVHSVLLNYIVKLQQKHIYDVRTLVGLLLVGYGEGGGGVEELQEVECSNHGGMLSTSGLDCCQSYNCTDDNLRSA